MQTYVHIELHHNNKICTICYQCMSDRYSNIIANLDEARWLDAVEL